MINGVTLHQAAKPLMNAREEGTPNGRHRDDCNPGPWR